MLVIVGKKVVDNKREKYNPITHRVSTLKIKKGNSAMLPNQIRIGVSSCSNITLVLK